jgi:hypothetical protein
MIGNKLLPSIQTTTVALRPNFAEDVGTDVQGGALLFCLVG